VQGFPFSSLNAPLIGCLVHPGKGPANRIGTGTVRQRCCPSKEVFVMKAKWLVRLGQPEWQRHTQSRCVGESLQMLGSVQRDAQVGALAVDGNGDFFQVNGEYVTPLNKHLISRAVKAAQGRAPSRDEPPRPRGVAAAPVVTVRRSRLAGSTPPPNPSAAGN
jgi:hypothetical protein